MHYQLIKKLLSPSEKKRFYWIFISMIIFSLFESLGLSMIIPYIGLLSQNETTINWIHYYLNLNLTENELIYSISFLFVLLFSLKFILQIYVNWESSRFPYEFYKNKSQQNYRNYINQPYLEFIKEHSSSYIKNCTTTIDQSANALVVYLRYLSAVVTTTFLFGLILLENFRISAALICVFSVIGYLIHKFSKGPQKKAGKEKEAYIAKLFQWINDTFVVFKEIKLYQKENRFFSIFSQYIEKLSQAHQNSVFYPTLPPIYIEYIAIVLLLMSVGFYISTGSAISDLIAPLLFYGAVGRRLLPSLTQTVSMRIQMQHFIPALECLDKELNKSSRFSNFERSSLPFQNSIEFSNIRFHYPTGDEVLRGVELNIKKNQSIAIVGPSGSGKSTIVKILLGLIKPSQGTALIDGHQCKNLNNLSHLIGYVPQDIALISGSILENITLCDETIDEQQLQLAIAMSHLEEYIQSLENGLDTQVGERGITLSGGQKQRLGIARALYQKPEILLFDEATSSLDNISESLVTNTIKEMAGKKTVIAVAHRLTTIQNFDHIFVLDKGKIIAHGSHQELLQSCFLYQSLTKYSNVTGCIVKI